ncbi:MAG: hypothetical protein KDD69_04785 [Bdellovibrionales bacterium]|nr:hypothetical protein [Bdellovibrionales bacterium]
MMNKPSLALLLLCCAGCSTATGYEGPRKAAEEVATVEGWGVTLHRVNGKTIGVNASGVEVLPGSNEFELTVDASNYHTTGPEDGARFLTMQAEAGSKYAVTAKRGDGRVCAFPLDMQGDPDFSHPAGCLERR